MYNALYLLRHHLESSALAHSWASVNHCTLSVVILELVHSLWRILPQWDETAQHFNVFYRPGKHVMKIWGATLFNRNDSA